ncbi:MAG: hypothetical protein CVV50_05805, partial [Spirochaetae bacterium HGW-Spirochaetae-6]
MDFMLNNVHRVDAAGETKGHLGVVDGLFNYKTTTKQKSNLVSFDVGEDYFVYPGFINAHDHLLGNYFPRVGKGTYLNWLPWDNDLKTAKVYQERGKLTAYETYFLGSL